MFNLIEAKNFEQFILLCIFINTILMMMIYYGASDTYTSVLEILNHILSLIFLVEATLKIYALRTAYFKDAWNIIDFIIVIVSIIDFIVTLSTSKSSFGSVVKIMRTFRVARIIKLMHNLKVLNRILMTFISVIP